MSSDDPTSVERIVQELLEKPLTKAERMERLRQLVRASEDVPDELLDPALQKLMEKLTE